MKKTLFTVWVISLMVMAMMLFGACGKKSENIIVKRQASKKKMELKKSEPTTQDVDEESGEEEYEEEAGDEESAAEEEQVAADEESEPAAEEPAADESGKININTASASELTKLPRIGTKTAERIIEFRKQNGPFSEIHDITKVSRIGEKTFENFKNEITVSGGGGKSSAVSKAKSLSKSKTASKAAQVVGGKKININTASQSDLESLPKIGPATAKKIIEFRKKNGPFKEPHDIVKVPRIGEKTYENFKDLITVK